ncbi:AraC family transcriptional regulator [Sciscionella marina]|uniref:AraC family transcriptional regulator n=1 Tax=Sciscionella marina TaxID=508770 RepID=UPI00036D5736|nr:helix-turn-helix domain-containing protein [Sciscionella marina]
MKSVSESATVAGWEVARPGPAARADMAGFRCLGPDPVDQRLIPRPCVTLVLQFGAGSLLIEDATRQLRCGSLAAWPVPGAVRMRAARLGCVEVRVSPVDAHRVLGVCPAELDGSVVSLEDLWGRESSRIQEQLGEARSWADRFALTDALLAARCVAGRPVDPEVSQTWKRVLGSHGLVRVEGLAEAVGWSRRRLWARFRAQIGLSPKRAAKLVRFDHAVCRLVAGDTAARIAADFGYADQSHLHRDVVAFTGLTPAGLARSPGLAVDDSAWAGGAYARIGAEPGDFSGPMPYRAV